MNSSQICFSGAQSLKPLSRNSVICGRTYAELTREAISPSTPGQEAGQSQPPQTITGSPRYQRPLPLRFLPVPLYLSGMILLWWLAWGLGPVQRTLSRLTRRGLMSFVGTIRAGILCFRKMKPSSPSAMSVEESGMSSGPMSCTKGETHGKQ